MCNREFSFFKGLTCFAVSFISNPKDGIINLSQILDPTIFSFGSKNRECCLISFPKILDEHLCTFLLEVPFETGL